MSTTFSHQTMSSRLLEVVISEQKSSFICNFKLEPITICHIKFVMESIVKNIIDVTLFFS